MQLIITVDTEADNQWKADKRKNISLENIKEIPRFQRLCEKYGYKPTYLIAYEITESEMAVAILKECAKNNKAEIGAHLHPWTNPPFYEGENRSENVYPSELTDSEFQEKLCELTKKITSVFGSSPTSFRSGRWGFDARMSDYLIKLGYLVDCSVTPKINWKNVSGKKGGPGGPDFRKAPTVPYYLSFDNVCFEDQDGLLEIPMTILCTGLVRSEKSHILKYFLGMNQSVYKKIVNKTIFKIEWCRIFPAKGFEVLKKVHKSAVKNSLPVLEFMIHSSELFPGGSPYTKSVKAVENVYENLEKFFKYLNAMNVNGITLSEYAKNYKNYANE